MNPTHGPTAWSLDDRSKLRAGGREQWTVLSGTSAIGHGFACRQPGAGAHRDIERGKVPSAARVACIARSACTSLDQNSNKENFSEQSGTDCRICIDYTSIYYCCKSFPVLLHDVMVGE